MAARGSHVRVRPSLLLGFIGVWVLYVSCGAGCAQPVHSAPTDAGTVAPSGTGESDFLKSLNAESREASAEKEAPVYVTAIAFLLKLGLVLGLAYLSILGLKHFSGVRGGPGPGRHRIRIIENSSLGTSKSLHLVEVGPKRLLLASTPNQITLISELGEEDLPEQPASEQTGVGGFREQLAMFLGSRADSVATQHRVADMLRNSTRYLESRVVSREQPRQDPGDQDA